MSLIADSLFAGLQRKRLERNQVNVNVSLLENVQWEQDPDHRESECGINFVDSDHLLAEALYRVSVSRSENERPMMK